MICKVVSKYYGLLQNSENFTKDYAKFVSIVKRIVETQTREKHEIHKRGVPIDVNSLKSEVKKLSAELQYRRTHIHPGRWNDTAWSCCGFKDKYAAGCKEP